jgi:hypothetical protein
VLLLWDVDTGAQHPAYYPFEWGVNAVTPRPRAARCCPGSSHPRARLQIACGFDWAHACARRAAFASALVPAGTAPLLEQRALPAAEPGR